MEPRPSTSRENTGKCGDKAGRKDEGESEIIAASSFSLESEFESDDYSEYNVGSDEEDTDSSRRSESDSDSDKNYKSNE